ncbi:MAG: DUF4369 domain-containing protein, partial [Bacteroidales bacterium]|nr:DUF4369 domain-containing protein [Bacteroidales bacterium]
MKKSFFGVIILLCLLAACAPKDQFTINGTFENVEDSTLVYLMIRGEKGFDKMDSCFITNSNFTLKGQIEQTQVVYLTIREFRFNYPIFVSPDAAVSISGTLDNVEITGSATQDEFKDYKNSLVDFQNQQQELYGQYQQTPKDDTIQLQAIEEKYNTLDSIINGKRNEWIQLHSNSVVAPYIVMTELV